MSTDCRKDAFGVSVGFGGKLKNRNVLFMDELHSEQRFFRKTSKQLLPEIFLQYLC